MPVQTLECLRLLTNIETEKRKLIQVVLFGQPELDTLLEHPSVRQLRQRITFTYRLVPLNLAATRAYVRHRLAVGGYRGPDLFGRDAISALHRWSGGIPRLINVLAHKALLAAFGSADRVVSARHVRLAVQDTHEARPGGFFRFLFPGRWLPGVVGAVALAVMVLSLGG